MKFRRLLSGLLFGLGCALSFIGLLSVVLPSIPNPQLQLILSGFEMTSTQPFVESINQLMRLVLAQNWRVFYLGLLVAVIGAILILQFTPKVQQPEKPLFSNPQAPFTQPEQVEKPNPYARAASFQPAEPETTCAVFQPEPILERNVIKETEPIPSFAQEVQPYFSPRFSTESHVTETATGSWSQSGSRILIRSAVEPAYEPQPEAPLSKTAPISPAPCPTAHPSAQMTSPRIRSTMGRHNH